MIDYEVDVAVIGGGPAGLAAAISARRSGAESVSLFDRNSWLGGILPQCIHDGFGVEETGTSMTGPEYAEKYIETTEKLGIEILKETKDPKSVSSLIDFLKKKSEYWESCDLAMFTLQAIGKPAIQLLLKEVKQNMENKTYNSYMVGALTGIVEPNVYDFMVKNPGVKVNISGNTDNVGTYEYNMKLSRERANSIVEYLTQKGISGSRMVARGFGFLKNVAPNTTDTGRQQNRRVEIEVISSD